MIGFRFTSQRIVSRNCLVSWNQFKVTITRCNQKLSQVITITTTTATTATTFDVVR